VEEDVTTNGNDIALVRLPRDAVTVLQNPEEFVLPICLPKSAADVFENADEYLVLLQKKFSGNVLLFLLFTSPYKVCRFIYLL
jgi:hypothetical protein